VTITQENTSSTLQSDTLPERSTENRFEENSYQGDVQCSKLSVDDDDDDASKSDTMTPWRAEVIITQPRQHHTANN